MNKIDLVVTYCDSDDSIWQQSFNEWKDKEIEVGITTEDNRPAFGTERTRNWDFMKYWLRGVEQNMPWINRVFFICQQPSQVPKWLNIECPKLRVVYHSEFIPSEFLPTFNPCVISTFIPLIEDLSECFIISDDDMFFLNPITIDKFFDKGISKQWDKHFWRSDNYANGLGEWGHTLDKSFNIEKRYGGVDYMYAPYHLPAALNKSLCKKILETHYDEIHSSLIISKFRNRENIGPGFLYCNIIKRTNKCIWDNHMYDDSYYVELKSGIDFTKCFTKQMVCFNDTENTDHFEDLKSQLLEKLQNRFPKLSCFEVGGKMLYDVALIIPCHNLEKWIVPCLDSILCQKNDLKINRLVYFVLDSCTDNTKSIIESKMANCTSWDVKITEVSVHSPGLARNVALDDLKATYIWFVDGDDWITCDNAIDEMYRLMVKDDKDIIEFKIKSKANPDGAFGGGTVWRAWLSSRIIGDMRFNDRQVGEDNDFAWDIWHKPGAKYGKIALAPYFYNFPREGSQMDKVYGTYSK